MSHFIHKGKLKKLLWFLLILFVIMNAIACFHAYKFTHFSATTKVKAEPGAMSATEKLSALFFGVDMPRPSNSRQPTVPYETVSIRSYELLEGWMIKTAAAKGTVVLFHGYGGEKSSMLDKAAVFRKLGYHTLLVDFMGAGGSEGRQTTIGYKEAQDIRSSVRFLEQHGEKNIILFGTSMGAAAIMKAIHDSPLVVRSVILECPFGTMLQTVKNRFRIMGVPSFPMAYLLMFWGGVQNDFNSFRHNPDQYAKKIRQPVLLMYGVKDEKVSLKETTAIYKNLAGPKKTGDLSPGRT